MLGYRHTKKTDHLVLLILIACATLLTSMVRLDFFASAIAFFGPPALYLTSRYPQNFYKAMYGGCVFGFVWGFSLDFMAEINGAWSWSVATPLRFPGVLFGVVSLDVALWFFLWAYLAVLYYESFVDHGTAQRIIQRGWLSLACGVVAAWVLVLIYEVYPPLLIWPYAYLFLGLGALGPFFFTLVRRPRLIRKLAKTIPYFFLLYFAYELTALTHDLWTFPGMYIGWVQFFSVRIPLEEFVFWIVLSGPVIASYYELFVDDMR